ncbi:hypothetical protein [Maritimibacter sp. DP1N21-5]|uniref:hypothetical protein n=1 Tax=Maritimibacter sp. DP1N21-5 TaxID=2836867 RepID=UPI001C452C4A|nr:hypothetical protein [Maritimibacter sp. DP1N21-5]MBV7408748.1 hypothetical protein [Maritimibacter sp. DP1N21-5]
MKIELKNIKYSSFASQETNCYDAALYIDGRKIGNVGNTGTGGSDYFYPSANPSIHQNRDAHARADAWCKANLPAVELGEGFDPVPADLELHCGALLDDYLLTRDLRSNLKRKVLFTMPGDTSVYFITPAKGQQLQPSHISTCRQRHPDATILNDLPEPEALAIYRAGV